jgi:hypothetical protein
VGLDNRSVSDFVIVRRNPEFKQADMVMLWISRRPTNLTGNCKGKTGSAADFSDDYLDYLGRSFETQTWVYEQASGWIFW